MPARPLARAAERSFRSVARDLREGLHFTLSQRWLSLTLVAVTVAMLFFLGPVFVLMPFVVKNHVHGGADGLGLVLATGGIGALAASLTTGQRGLPRRPLPVIYVAWAVACFALIGYASADRVWEAMLVSACSVGALVTGQILWESLLQASVPGDLLGRVASFDAFVSSGLAPLSFAITGPIAAALGPLTTLRWAGIFSGGILMLALLASVRHTPRAVRTGLGPGRA
jgi:hypothetical protein